jgi:hypothetical protein
MISITIHTDRDLTPPGVRSFRIVQLRGGQHLRWYLDRRIYRTLPFTLDNLALSREWWRAK